MTTPSRLGLQTFSPPVRPRANHKQISRRQTSNRPDPGEGSGNWLGFSDGWWVVVGREVDPKTARGVDLASRLCSHLTVWHCLTADWPRLSQGMCFSPSALGASFGRVLAHIGALLALGRASQALIVHLVRRHGPEFAVDKFC